MAKRNLLVILHLICLAQFIYSFNIFSNRKDSLDTVEEIKDDETTIELVQILFRHGDRTPVRSYPKDPFKESAWAKYGGYGQLTQDGMRRHFEFGQSLRKMYTQLNKYYDRNKHYVRSTDYDRTLMSAYSLLSGLFEPKDYQKWNPSINWQPIAVHTTEEWSDKLFYGGKCVRYDELKTQVLETAQYKELNAKYQQLFELIDEDAGFTNMSLIDLWEIGDVLMIEKANGFKLPDWAEQNLDQIKESLKWGFHFDFYFPEMAKIKAGSILNQIRKNILQKTNKTSSSSSSSSSSLEYANTKQELALFSSHDTYVAAMTKLLNLAPFIAQPPFCSAVLFELRKSDKNKYFVQVLLKNNTPEEPIEYKKMIVDGCDQYLCPLEKFLNLTESLILEDGVKACDSSSSTMYEHLKQVIEYGAPMTSLTLGLTFSFATLFAITVICLAIVNYFKSKSLNKKNNASKNRNYRKLNNNERRNSGSL